MAVNLDLPLQHKAQLIVFNTTAITIMDIPQKILLHYPKRTITGICCLAFGITLLLGKFYTTHIDHQSATLEQQQELLQQRLQHLERHLQNSNVKNLTKGNISYTQTLEKLFDLATSMNLQVLSSQLINTYQVIGLTKNQLEVKLTGNYANFILLLQTLAGLRGVIVSWRDISIKQEQDAQLSMLVNFSLYNVAE